ncbi:MAG: rod shape-determining protein MreC [Acidimicrobiia bacterium]|nr:rod shape-determining protein MreC [Acidimicrobiia bacterium]
MAVPRPGGRRRTTLVLLVLTAITLLTLDLRGFGPLESMQEATRSVLNPLRDGAGSAFDPVADAWNGVTDYDDLERENATLRAQLEELQGLSIAETAALSELEALNRELDLDFLGDGDRVIARVVGGSTGNFSPFTVEIDKGSSSGLAEGQPVITEAGLVGQLVQVSRSRSVVQLINDPEFTAAVRLSGSRDVGIGRGNGEDQRTFIVDQGIAIETEVTVGEAATTAGGRSRFPAGVPVGLVSSIAAADNQLERRVIITLGADVDNLEFVSVITVAPSESAEGEAPPEPSGTDTTLALPTTTDVAAGGAP